MEPVDRDKVVSIVKLRGPLIPNELRKALGMGDTTLLGAVLSELSSKGLVKVSRTKLGGSPFYYDPAKPESIERLSQHLGEKEQRAYHLLKEKRVLRDDRQEALVRVCLRNIKDFARMLTVNAPEGQVVYWKYYLLDDGEAERLIKRDLGMEDAAPRSAAAPPQETPQPAKSPEQARPSATAQQRSAQAPAPVKEATASSAPAGSRQAAPREEAAGAPAKESQETLEAEEIDDPFYRQVKAYFDKHGIAIKERQLVRKRSELDLVIGLPTPVGTVDYYCKAKAKKRSNDGDLAAAKLQGHSRNLPTLYLTTGEITKKAKEKLQRDLKGVIVKEL